MEVKFYKVQVSGHIDERRTILDFSLPAELKIPFEIRQDKIVQLSEKAINEELVMGNHYHTEKSGRWEFFVVGLGSFRMRFGKVGGKIQEKTMNPGDACLIPPTWSHAFVGLEVGSQLWGLSNLPYDSKHDIPSKLF